MLDSETKRRIDTCRDILVGKVPDPKSQVEQITIALIYKFMDDMDAEAEELGGTRSFFTGDYAKYGWSKLMAPNMGGFDVLSLYSEAIQKMNENPGVPALFRDIFKNAYLPYRDPETLRSFLKEINTFNYDHSERLGDAFEYLLSVLGSQGEAGQFRTPRHIIDFMVELIDPKKDETILDPACGTAGFLISSYKHILKHNTRELQQPDRTAYNEKGVDLESLTLDNPLRYKGDLLTPDDKKRIATNIRGYDISPDMVRLSLVNMYLHGFTDPHIDEYDTLTSDEKWIELADVILANPPFMSPKGGIKPHKRFSVQAKRSEVLFVDYIAEHLTPNGRAAVVVPEGIIFQSGTAYKQLREMLVKDYLVAVISLPAGVFNPYSGVKTSILVMDKRLAKKTSEILFAKIDNDGFNLGAQRRPIDKNDLPAASRNIRAWLENARNGGEFNVERLANLNLVTKEKIGENGEWNLSGERYRDNIMLEKTVWPVVQLGDLCTFMTGGTPTSTRKDYYENGDVPWLVSGDIHQGIIQDCKKSITELGVENSNAKVLPFNSVLIALNGQGKTRGMVALLRMNNTTCNQSLVSINPKNREELISEYLFYVLHSMYQQIRELTGDGQRSGLNIPIIKRIKIPLPPLEVQQEIVAEMEGYQKIIDGAHQVVENYQPRIPINPDWPTVPMSEVIEDKPKNGYSGKPVDYKTNLKVLSLSATTSGTLDASKFKYLDEDIPLDAPIRCKPGDIYLQRGNTRELVGTAALFDIDDPGYIYPDLMIRVRANQSRISTEYLLHTLQSQHVREHIIRHAVGAAGSMPKINQKIVADIPIPLPDLDTQSAIVAQIKNEQKLVNANKELINLFEDKIKTTINRVWGEAE